jgi:beta-phosphoglucomutase family hydrolase
VTPSRNDPIPFDWTQYDAVLFDLDGVITPTAEVHERAWASMFNAFLATRTEPTAAYTDADYFAYIDGKPRYDGVRDFLASRGIQLPHGTPADDPSELTVCGLGNRKNDVFNEVLETEGVVAFPGSIALLDHLATLGMPLAIVSSSKNATNVLRAAGLTERFGTIVDGLVAVEVGLPGKPAPHMFQHAALTLGVPDNGSVVVEDAVSGVQAGAAGDFAVVIGVDRGAGNATLTEAGADLVVTDLQELVP